MRSLRIPKPSQVDTKLRNNLGALDLYKVRGTESDSLLNGSEHQHDMPVSSTTRKFDSESYVNESEGY